MASSTETRDFGLAPILSVLRRRWGLIVLCTFVIGGSAAALSLRQTPEYSASASLLFRDPAFDVKLFGAGFFSPSADPQRAAATNERLVGLETVAARTAKVLGGGLTPASVQSAVSSEQSGQSDVVVITAEWPRPAMAAKVANTFAEQFIEFRRDADRSKIRESRKLVEAQLAGPVASGTREAASLRARLQQLEVVEALQTGNAELVQRAAAPSGPSSPRPTRDIGIGVILGLVVGLMLAFLFEHLDRRIREPDDLAAAYELPLLTAVPQSSAFRRSRAEIPAAEMEAFHMLRARLRYFNLDRRISTLLVTSAAPGEGKTTVAWNLGMAHVLAGQRTLLLEADLRRPTLASLHGLHSAPGLADLVISQATFADAVQAAEPPDFGRSANGSGLHPHLDVIVAGLLPPNPAALLESHRFDELLAAASENYEIIIIDTPPVSVVSDALPLLERVDGVVVVGRIGQTRTDDARRLRDQMVAAPALGVVANAVKFGGGYDGYGYGYGYGNYGALPETQAQPDPRALATDA